MTAVPESQADRDQRERERHEEWWAEPKPFVFEVPDEPAELTAQADAIRAQREHQDAKCGQCGSRRAAHFKSSGHVIGIDHPFVEPCPNEDDDVLCAEDENGLFVPECGCPRHDPDPESAS